MLPTTSLATRGEDCAPSMEARSVEAPSGGELWRTLGRTQDYEAGPPVPGPGRTAGTSASDPGLALWAPGAVRGLSEEASPPRAQSSTAIPRRTSERASTAIPQRERAPSGAEEASVPRRHAGCEPARGSMDRASTSTSHRRGAAGSLQSLRPSRTDTLNFADALRRGSAQRLLQSTTIELLPERSDQGESCAVVRVHGQTLHICKRSLFLFPLEGRLRQAAIALVQWKWFDRLILASIILNSVLLATYQWRPSATDLVYNYWNDVASDALTGIFTLECLVRIVAWGFILDSGAYLRDPWNILDFIVVVSGLIDLCTAAGGNAFSILRLCRALRPLRSLNAHPELKMIVNTTLSAIPRLGNVTAFGLFIFTVFSIVGVTLMQGIFYRRCRETPEALFCENCATGGCWQWNYTMTESAGRLCGGAYMCEHGEFCRGHLADPDVRLRPTFRGPHARPGSGGTWCDGSEPTKWSIVDGSVLGISESDFIHFDHFAAAFLLIFQCMTTEGWTTIMYYAQDGYDLWIARVYFMMVVICTCFFLLNVALAVVDEARDDYEDSTKARDRKDEHYVQRPGVQRESRMIARMTSAKSRITAFFDTSGRALLARPHGDAGDGGNSTPSAAGGEEVVQPITPTTQARALGALMALAGARDSPEPGMRPLESGFSGAGKSLGSRMMAAVRSNSSKEGGAVSDGSQEGDGEASEGDDDEDKLWLDVVAVRVCRTITRSETFSNLILLVITGNVVVMCLEFYPPDVAATQPKFICNTAFMAVFVLEMVLELMARGPCQYVKVPQTAFDGFVVVASIVELVTGGQGGLKALRTLRLFRVLMKMTIRFPSLGVLLKAMLGTGRALRYWLLVFVLVLCIFTLLMMNFFANNFHFEENNVPPQSFAKVYGDGLGDPWCPGTSDAMRWNDRQDCIPRTHFDTFLQGFVTVYQIMTQENWNNILYAGMRAGGSGAAILFVFVMTFGQTLFLSLFLSMLISKFGEYQNALTAQLEEAALKKMGKCNSQLSTKTQNVITATNLMMALASSRRRPSAEAGMTKVVPSGETQRTPTGRSSLGSNASDDAPRSTASAWQHAAQKVKEQRRAAENEEKPPPKPKPKWPKGYAWFMMTTSHPVRRAALWVLTLDVHLRDAAARKRLAEQKRKDREDEEREFIRGPKSPHKRTLFDVAASAARHKEKSVQDITKGIREREQEPTLIFDNIILVAILLSTITMIVDSPLQDVEHNAFIALMREMDTVFTILFIFEMSVKLLAYPLVWGEGAYLWSAGCAWNWLDAIVVIVSVIGLVVPNGPKFVKTLRILRAFRPLRVISRNQNLKVVIETVFKSMQELGWLLVVFLLFLLIFALMFLVFLGGQMEICTGDGITYMRDIIEDPTPPLCFGSSNFSEIRSAVMAGEVSVTASLWDAKAGNWSTNECTMPQVSWQRASHDTPICVGSCDALDYADTPRPPFCPPPYTRVEELPSLCGGPLPAWDPGQVGQRYVDEMQRSYAVPCAGTTPASVRNSTAHPAAGLSCRDIFCPTGISDEKIRHCSYDCANHPFYCADTCNDCAKTGNCPDTCLSCLAECEAACQCDYCRPMMKDAALCYEQGGTWGPVIPPNFDNIANAMLALLQIATTEGWSDVLHAACDSIDMHVQPLRDTSFGYYAPLFLAWMCISSMFLLNLGVGVIVDKFMDMRSQGQDTLLTEWQKKWKSARHSLYARMLIFNLDNLHMLPPWRKRVYNLVESSIFETFIMLCIVVNTITMAMKAFPEPAPQWEDHLGVLNYALTLVYMVEAGLKMFAYHMNYFRNRWNLFDFVCVCAGILGLVLQLVVVSGQKLAPVMTVLRIFRVARLFRIVKSLKGMNRLFIALTLSLPKLVNVVGILLLFLVLFSILGVQLFATTKTSSDLDVHANFQDFWQAFTTLFRAATGEAWDAIMNDMGKTEVDFFREGTWCVPAELYDWQNGYDILHSKCLIDTPSSCIQTIWGWNAIPYIYWVIYTLLIGLVVMNLVISVILDGYEECKEDTALSIEVCKELWPKYDPDLRMSITLPDAMRFIREAVREITGKEVELFRELQRIPMRHARIFDLIVEGNGQVHFQTTTRQVLRFMAVVEAGAGEKIISELDKTDQLMDSKELKRLRELERRAAEPPLTVTVTSCGKGWAYVRLTMLIATMKVQRLYRDRKVWQARKFWRSGSASTQREGEREEFGTDASRAPVEARTVAQPEEAPAPAAPPPGGPAVLEGTWDAREAL